AIIPMISWTLRISTPYSSPPRKNVKNLPPTWRGWRFASMAAPSLGNRAAAVSDRLPIVLLLGLLCSDASCASGDCHAERLSRPRKHHDTEVLGRARSMTSTAPGLLA